MTIANIENIAYNEAKEMTLETLKIKDHDCIFLEFDNVFGYSVLVFKNGKHVYYANDYELHHSYMIKNEGREIKTMVY